MTPEPLRALLTELFASQPLAVLSTQGGGQPYASLVAFATADDLRTLLFATDRATRKYANIEAEPRVALLVDSRSNQEADFQRAVAVTAIGTAREVAGDERERLLPVYLFRHQHLDDFVSAPTSALVEIQVEAYYVVRQFQNVSVLTVAP